MVFGPIRNVIQIGEGIGGSAARAVAGFIDDSFATSDLPWARQGDAFFSPKDIDPERADGIYPYRLVVVDVKAGNSIVGFGGFGDGSNEVIKYVSDTGGIQYEIGNTSVGSWSVTLPITPQQLSITDQFAVNTTATMRGVVEEHNGVKFKIISASGTTGIWPTRDKLEDPVPSIPTLGGFATNVSESFQGITNAFDRLKRGGNASPVSLDFKEDNQGKNTGYFQAQLIQQFIEQYAMAKKNPANKGWRLVFDCPKINESFVVTPLEFTTTKSQRSPAETLYSMKFKAWKRIKINQGNPFPFAGGGLQAIDANFLQRLNNTLDNTRSLMSASLNVIKAVRADFRAPFDTLRKVSLLVKDASGLALSVSDLPNQIISDINSSIKTISRDLSDSEANFRAAFGSSSNGKGPASRTPTSEKIIRKTISLIKDNYDKNEGLSADAVEAGQNGVFARDASRISPLNNVFDEPEGFFDYFSGILVDDLQLNTEQNDAINDETELNSLISIEEVKDFTKQIQELILDLTNNFGAGDEFFSEVYGRPAPKERSTPMSIEEFELISALESAVLEMNLLTATREFDDRRIESPLQYVGGLAEQSNIPFNSEYTAKYLAPVPFGLTIQQIAARYMGDPDLYNEIVTLNNLRSPYIDEEGFFYEFLSNGDGRQFNLSSTENLFIGQKVQLSSNTVPTFTRVITAIDKITDTNYLITVDGLSDLDLLKTSDEAKIKAFLPGTVNSQNQIWIPTNEAIDEEPRTFDIPHLDGDDLTGLSKIDWLLQDNGDLVINSFGEIALANGITNLIQALRMKVVTQKGSLLSDVAFGLGLKPGINVNDITIENVLKDLRSMVLQDSRFEGVDKIEMNLLPPDISITIQARLARGRGIFPINFTIPL
jgi:hypothetical protein